MKWLALFLACACSGVLIAADEPAAPKPYTNDFEKAEIGKVPEDLMILDGTFAVRELDGNKCLELAGDPIGSFGATFGPDGASTVDVKARIWAASSGKRFPEIGIGAGDAGGYKLFLIPARHVMELRRGDETAASTPFEWSSGSWNWFRLRVAKDKTTWVVQGKVWPQGQKEPAHWMVTAPDAEAPPTGKASIWGNDFSEQPIRFDDLSVTPIP